MYLVCGGARRAVAAAQLGGLLAGVRHHTTGTGGAERQRRDVAARAGGALRCGGGSVVGRRALRAFRGRGVDGLVGVDETVHFFHGLLEVCNPREVLGQLVFLLHKVVVNHLHDSPESDEVVKRFFASFLKSRHNFLSIEG